MDRRSLLCVAGVAAMAAVLSGCAQPGGTAMGASTPSAGMGAATNVTVYAAGSLREAFTEIAREHEVRTGQKAALTFGASGLLRERIESGEPAMVFASADTEHPQRLARAGDWGAPQVFTRNALCALAAPGVPVTTANLLDTLLRADMRLGTSTPQADPSGDYAWELFRRAEQVRPGAFARLEAKALQLTGGPTSPKAPPGRGTYAWVMAEGRADVFLTYCTNAVSAQREVPALQVVQVPPELQVAAAYGLTVRRGAPQAALDFAQTLMAEPAQRVLRRLGFAAP